VSRSANNAAASRHFGAYRVTVGRGESVRGEGEDLRLFHCDVAAV